MAFVVEDGTGLDDANAGASDIDADVYFEERAVTAWTGTDVVKQSAIIRATDYIELRFASRFAGTKEFDLQALSFPRLDTNGGSIGVPTAYMRAVFEYALRALSGPLAPDLTVAASGLSIIAESHKTGPITDSFRYASKGTGSMPTIFKPYPAADALLYPLLKRSTGVIR